MIFTDADLKRLKMIDLLRGKFKEGDIGFIALILPSFISRLEAAEVYAMACPTPFGDDLKKLRQEWFKASGKINE